MKIKLIAAMTSLMFLSGCYTFKETTSQYERLPITKLKEPTKVGKSCGEYSFPLSYFYINSDLTVEAARKDGDISEIVSIENEKTYRPFYTKICTVVRGN